MFKREQYDLKQESYRSMTLSSGSIYSSRMASVIEGASKIDVMIEEHEMTIQKQLYVDLVHSVICGHMTFGLEDLI